MIRCVALTKRLLSNGGILHIFISSSLLYICAVLLFCYVPLSFITLSFNSTKKNKCVSQSQSLRRMAIAYALLAQLTHTAVHTPTNQPTSQKIKDRDFVSNKIYNNYKKRNETIVHSVVHRWIHKFTTRVWRIRTVTKEQNDVKHKLYSPEHKSMVAHSQWTYDVNIEKKLKI